MTLLELVLLIAATFFSFLSFLFFQLLKCEGEEVHRQERLKNETLCCLVSESKQLQRANKRISKLKEQLKEAGR